MKKTRAVLISIKPEWCHLIVDGKKTIEIRKTKPKLETPFKCYIYCTAGDYEWKKDCWATAYQTPNGSIENMSQMVIGEFVCDEIYDVDCDSVAPFITGIGYVEDKLCFGRNEFIEYGGLRMLYGWRISDLKIYDKPKELYEFYKNGMLSYDDWLYAIHRGNGGATSKYESYKNVFRLKRPPQSWCYVEETI